MASFYLVLYVSFGDIFIYTYNIQSMIHIYLLMMNKQCLYSKNQLVPICIAIWAKDQAAINWIN